MKLNIGNDHAGFTLKEKLVEYLKEQGHEIHDFGCYSEESVDYPDFAHAVCEDIMVNDTPRSILICGSGNGINITANKHKHVRSALCWEEEISELARLHNDANVIAIPARFISVEKAKAIVDKFINTEFEGGRHKRRVDKISENI